MNEMDEGEIVERWEERAAIMEHDGGLSRQFAEFMAAKEIRKQCGSVPAVVADRMNKTEGQRWQEN